MLKPMKTGKHKAYKHSHISERKFRELLRAFSIDLNAYEARALANWSVTKVSLGPPESEENQDEAPQEKRLCLAC